MMYYPVVSTFTDGPVTASAIPGYPVHATPPTCPLPKNPTPCPLPKNPTPCPLPKYREGEDRSTASWLPSLYLGRGQGVGSEAYGNRRFHSPEDTLNTYIHKVFRGSLSNFLSPRSVGIPEARADVARVSVNM